MTEVAAAFQCDTCGKTFETQRALGGHLAGAHPNRAGTSKTARNAKARAERVDEDSVSFQVEARLRELIAPFEEEIRTIDRRLLAMGKERRDLLSAKKRLEKSLMVLRPQTGAKANTAGITQASNEAKRKAVEEFIEAHAGDLAGGFTASDLNRRMKAEDFGPAMSPDKTLRLLETLRDYGVVRADRMIRGGGMQWMIVGQNGDGDGEA